MTNFHNNTQNFAAADQSNAVGYHPSSSEEYVVRTATADATSHAAEIHNAPADLWRHLKSAAMLGNQDLVDSLLKSGANPNSADNAGWSPLMAAAEFGHQGAVDSLLKAGANPDAVDNHGYTALESAEIMGHQGIVASLRNADAKHNAADDNARSDVASTGMHEDPAEPASMDICFEQEAPLDPLDDGALAHEFFTESRAELLGQHAMGTSFDMCTQATPSSWHEFITESTVDLVGQHALGTSFDMCTQATPSS